MHSGNNAHPHGYLLDCIPSCPGTVCYHGGRTLFHDVNEFAPAKRLRETCLYASLIQPVRRRPSGYGAITSARCESGACYAEARVSERKASGARRDRTDDLMLAKHALSQLSYGPRLRPTFAPGGFGVASQRLPCRYRLCRVGCSRWLAKPKLAQQA